jgi:hypothetical protein
MIIEECSGDATQAWADNSSQARSYLRKFAKMILGMLLLRCSSRLNHRYMAALLVDKLAELRWKDTLNNDRLSPLTLAAKRGNRRFFAHLWELFSVACCCPQSAFRLAVTWSC